MTIYLEKLTINLSKNWLTGNLSLTQMLSFVLCSVENIDQRSTEHSEYFVLSWKRETCVTLSSRFSLSCCSRPTLRCWTRGFSGSGTMSSIKKSSTKKVFSSFCWVPFGPWSLATILSFFILHPRAKVSRLDFAQKAFACYFSSAFTARNRGLQGLLGYY